MTDRNTSIRRQQLKPILDDDLDATNSPSDGQIPSWNASENKFTWVEQSAGEVTTYTDTFVDADLDINNILTVAHNLGQKLCIVEIYDNNYDKINLDDIQLVDTNSLNIDLSSFAPITGTWNVIVKK